MTLKSCGYNGSIFNCVLLQYTVISETWKPRDISVLNIKVITSSVERFGSVVKAIGMITLIKLKYMKPTCKSSVNVTNKDNKD